MSNTILITGATGLIGTPLSYLLKRQGYDVVHLSRGEPSKNSPFRTYIWNVDTQEVDLAAFEGVRYIVHLAGAGIADKRWSSSRKKELIMSRVASTKLLAHGIQGSGCRPSLVVCANAIGYYGDTGSEWVTEQDAQGAGFMAGVCAAWQHAVEQEIGENLGIATSIIRVGIVLDSHGGALAKMLPSYKMHIGAYFGNGRQYMPWIHRDDICGIFAHIIQHELVGIYNGVAPNPITSREFTQAVGRGLKLGAIAVPIPAFVLRVALGEMADVLLLGSRVSADLIQRTGYRFLYPEATKAIRELTIQG
jgi:uncharacterized protein (TIGR01777 family)